MPKQNLLNNKDFSHNLTDFDKKQMATLTTFNGLDDLIKSRMKLRDKLCLRITDEDLDLKKGLYQIMDNTPLYKYSTYKIYKKEAPTLAQNNPEQ